jgi:multidrug efflux pump subunit AcrA (membrane-fusion protein)
MAVRVTIGVTDGKFTEVVSGNLQEGMQVITDSITPSK